MGIDFRRVLKNQMLLFTANRYLGYTLLFVRGVLVAKFLGPEMFGVWGFLMLMQQYLAYASFGMQYALNVELSTNASASSEKRAEWMGTALIHVIAVACVLSAAGLIIQIGKISVFDKYLFNRFALMLGINTGLNMIQELFTTMYRAHRKLMRIAVSELLTAITPLLAVLVFNGEFLIYFLFGALILQGLITIAQFSIRAPFRITFRFNPSYWKQLLLVGIPLLVYSASFALIAIFGRTVISVFYSAEVMGYYSLANNITAATLLGLNAISFIVFPDILSRTHAGVADDLVAAFVRKVNDLYSNSVFLAVFVVAQALPALFFFLPQFKPASGTLSVLLLSQAVFSVSFGYNCVAIARKEQMKVAGISLTVAAIVIGLCLLVVLFKMDFLWVAISVLAGSFIYTVWQARLGARLLHMGHGSGYMKSILPWGSLAATLLFLTGILIGYPALAGWIGIIVFIFANWRKLVLLLQFINQKIGKPTAQP